MTVDATRNQHCITLLTSIQRIIQSFATRVVHAFNLISTIHTMCTNVKATPICVGCCFGHGHEQLTATLLSSRHAMFVSYGLDRNGLIAYT